MVVITVLLVKHFVSDQIALMPPLNCGVPLGIKCNSDAVGVIIIAFTVLPRGDQGIISHVFDPSGYLLDGEILCLGWN